MIKKESTNHKIFKMAFGSVYPHYVNKVERKGQSKADLHYIITWLTGYSDTDLENIINKKTDFETFFENAPSLHPNAHKITGMICGHRIEDIENPLMQKIRWMDKIVDELAKGRKMEKILRK